MENKIVDISDNSFKDGITLKELKPLIATHFKDRKIKIYQESIKDKNIPQQVCELFRKKFVKKNGKVFCTTLSEKVLNPGTRREITLMIYFDKPHPVDAEFGIVVKLIGDCGRVNIIIDKVQTSFVIRGPWTTVNFD